MQFTRLGKSGLSVSRLCLGCMSYGDTSKGWHGEWLLDEDAARPFFSEARDGGVSVSSSTPPTPLTRGHLPIRARTGRDGFTMTYN